MASPDDDRHGAQGATSFLLAVAAGLAVILFFVGTSSRDYDFVTPLGHTETVEDPDVGPAPNYRALRNTPRGTSSGLDEDLAVLASAAVPAAGGKAAALAERSTLRSYEGAPPRIPHSVRQDAAPECLSCHDEGLVIRGKQALPMGHRELASCTQCHVVTDAPMPGGADLPPDPRDVPSSFVGMEGPDRGPRAWSSAPPQMPHPEFMRERCLACHGDLGRSGMQTPHAWRTNCEQCHAPSAQVDQRPGVER